MALQGIAEIIVIAYLLIVPPRLAKRSLGEIGFRSLRAGDGLAIAIGIIAMAVVLTLLGTALSALLRAHTPEEAIKVFLGLKSPLSKAGFAFFAVVLAPFFEEFVFRLFLFNAFRRWWGFWPGAIVELRAVRMRSLSTKRRKRQHRAHRTVDAGRLDSRLDL